MAKKRAFVRYSKQGKIVPGSLILTSGSYPNGPSTWSEVPADLCCVEAPAPQNLILSYNVNNPAISLVAVYVLCNSTGRVYNASIENSTDAASLETILNQEFSDIGVFTFIPGTTYTFTLELTPEKVEELTCEGGYLSFQIVSDL